MLLSVQRECQRILIGQNIASNNYEDVLNSILISGELDGNIISNSILFNAERVDNEGEVSAILTRNSFEDISSSPIATYLENNYSEGSEAKDTLYNILKTAETSAELDNMIEGIFSETLFTTLNEQTVGIQKSIQKTLVENISMSYEDTRLIASVDYKYEEVKGSHISKIENNLVTGYIGMDYLTGANNRTGAVIAFGSFESKYTDAKRADFYAQLNAINTYSNDSYKIFTNLFIGTTNGNLKRDISLGSIENNFKSDIRSHWFGASINTEKKLGFGIFDLTPSIEMTALYLHSDGISENGDYAIKTSSNDDKLFNTKVGLDLSKTFTTNDLLFTPNLGVYYTHEFGNYSNVNGKMESISEDNFYYKNDNELNYSEIKVGVSVQKDSLTFNGSFTYNFTNDSTEGQLGFVYSF